MKKIEGFESEKIIVLPAYQLEQIVAHPLNRMLYLTDIGFYPRARYHYRERPNGCDTYILIYCAEGEGRVSIGGVLHVLKERQLIVIPARTPHSYWTETEHPWTIYWFHFKGEQAEGYSALLKGGAGPLTLGSQDSEKFIALFHQCYDLLSGSAHSASHQVYAMQTAAYAISSLGMIPEREDEDRKKQYIETAIHLMNMKLEESLTLDEIAQYTQISRQHLNHLFKTSVGFAPVDYYLRLKMRRASQLLDLTPMSIKEICHTLGFKDPYYFSRLFRKIIGLSPTDYRNKLKG
ncbi:HTH-type transcriptional activator Btr [Paenibacillus auburnensis]|uniref:HTH-type transcriptional activator Btr n=1 Tax=Paenibacillus auburnensis TaxID=2905649 RepID=A0ABM9CQY9_9BACL|nr:AraC family transcriptional regulator [Paenibacillus auburnensis]CAH1221770.1 HTH-type transcriptional activator Btr [Paenibacillus auburnensis]